MSPFQSKKQQRFMHAVHPKMAKEWDAKTDFSKLPEKKETEEAQTFVNSYITDTGKFVRRHSRGNEMTKIKKPETGGSMDGSALFKEDMPKAFKSVDTADVFMNVKKDITPIRGALETSEDDTLMGRLAKRMVSRDYIDNLNLGTGTKAQRTGKAATADLSDNIPQKINIGGPALKEGTKVEHEHDATIKKFESGKLKAKDVPESIAKDHIKETGPEYYEELKEMENKLKKNETSSKLMDEKGFGLHLQTSDIKAFNSNDPISSTNQIILPGRNMAEQARKKGNVFESEEFLIAPDQK